MIRMEENMTETTPRVRGRKRRLLAKIAIGLLLIIAIFCVIVATRPSHYEVQRSSTIAAPAPVVFEQINDFHNWEGWSPWSKLDPAAKNSFEGPTSGKGAVFKWSGNDKVGEGTMTLIDSQPNQRVKIRIDFVRPFKDTSIAEFTFKPDGDKTAVTWSMSGEQNFIGKAVCLFMNMDKMLGGDFEKGLAQMKAVAEAKVSK
jgi:uncharacterized protein YndB with AHSA1/START domain